MNALVPQSFGAISTVFQQGGKIQDDLSAGVQSGFGLIGIKGKVWSTRYRGETRNLMRPDGDGPRNSIEVVILKSSSSISKIFYENGYVDGSTAAPDCFSTNGVHPDASAAKRQAPVCASCPRNIWGSRITAEGKQGKQCSDSKRLAVVPLEDIANERLGGPMLLRVPAASLQQIADFGIKMASWGYPYYAIGVRIAFEPTEAFPKFVLSAIRPLSDAEAQTVLAMRDGPAVTRILAESSEFEAAPPPPTPAGVFEQAPQGAQVSQSALGQSDGGAGTVGTGAQSGFGGPQAASSPTPAPAPAQLLAQVTQGGFGATAPATAQPVAQQQVPVTQATEVASATVQPASQAQPLNGEILGPGSDDDFMAELDRKLGALLPA